MGNELQMNTDLDCVSFLHFSALARKIQPVEYIEPGKKRQIDCDPK
jgi:hypothetical protein